MQLPRDVSPRAIVGVIILSAFVGGLGLIIPVSVDLLLDRAVPAGSFCGVLALAAGFTLLGWLIAWLEYRRGLQLQRLFVTWAQRRFGRVADVLQMTPLVFHRRWPAATVVARTLGIERVRESLSVAALGVVISTAVLVTSGFYLLWLQPAVGAIVLGALAMLGLGHVHLVRRQVALRRSAARHETEEAAFAAAIVHAQGEIAMLDAGDRVHARWRELQQRRVESSRRAQRLRDLQQAIDLAVTFWGPALFFIGLLVLQRQLTEGDIAAAYAAFGQCLLAVYTLSFASGQLVHAAEGQSMYSDLLVAPQLPETDLSAPDPGPDAIVAQDLSLAFVSGHDVLHGLGFRITAGERVALVGGSGVGKSTLLRLISGIETPTGGAIAVFGADPTRFTAEAAREVLAYAVEGDDLSERSDARLILIDELLDGYGAAEVQSKLAHLGQATVIAATHRHAGHTAFDRVLFVHKGRIAGLCPHEELLADSGDYRTLVSGVG